MRNPSKWGYWKRNQRITPKGGKCSKCGKRISGRPDNQHKNNRQSDNSPRNLKRLCRSCHTAEDNRKGRHKKRSKR